MPGRDWLLVLLGAIGFIVLSHQIPILRQLGSSTEIEKWKPLSEGELKNLMSNIENKHNLSIQNDRTSGYVQGY